LKYAKIELKTVRTADGYDAIDDYDERIVDLISW